MRRKRSSGILRFFRAVCSFVLISSLVYILVAGLTLYAGVAVAIACVGVAAPLVLGGGDVLEIVIEFFGALIEGVVAIFEAIASIFANLFD